MEGVVVQFDLGVFSVEAVKKAAYKYINKFSTDFALQVDILFYQFHHLF